MTTFLSAVTADHFDTEVLQQHWIPLAADDADTAAVLRERLGIDFTAAHNQVWEAGNFLYLPVVANYQLGETIERATIVFALGGEFLVTLQPSEHFVPFDKAVAKMRRNPELAGSAHGVMYALLWALNEASERVLHHTGDALEATHEEIERAIYAHDRREREFATSDVRGALSRMNATERIIARTRETQLQLARAARHLRADARSGRGELDGAIGVLLADIDGVGQRAGVAYDKVRYRQQSALAGLDVRQNEIVKAFAVTAAALPPTLIATCYAVDLISELSWQTGLLVTCLLTLAAALIPLAYLKNKGLLG
ncbi:magnesium transporter [Nocardia sputorum]|uniref:CorA family divalent cation transporter n=1 Tax=Nocardia sputorum TaxID=2984338 RepID=UPI00248FD024|nr:CorA family divalent cation transporter [Nocardia sputorum]BDT92034.1 magnesium transporter [Nocardia sputorum]